MKTKLREAIEDLYIVFRDYKIDSLLLRKYSCPCCVTDEEIRAITQKSLKDLSGNDIGHFMRSAITTFGTVDDYKHFLPRILELMSLKSSSDLIGDFTCFEKLNYAEWETWPEKETQVIEKFFSELWYAIINDEWSSEFEISEAFELITIYGSIKKSLELWTDSKTEISSLFIVEGVLNGFAFRGDDYFTKIVSKWLYSKPILDKLEYTFFNQKEKEAANRTAIVHSILENKYPISFNY
ncbi:hypothetical protein [Aquimarina sp. 433]